MVYDITEEYKNVDYKKYKGNNSLVCDALKNSISEGHGINSVMVFEFSLETETVQYVNNSRMITCNFRYCEFNDNMHYNVFEDTTFVGCTFYCDIDETKFINCHFISCKFISVIEHSEFTSSTIKNCTFDNCDIYCDDNNGLFAAKDIINPIFSNCILPNYVTDDFVYEAKEFKDSKQPWLHANFYFFIKSCKLISIDGMITIDDYMKKGKITDSIRYIFCKKITKSDTDIRNILDRLIAKRTAVISKLVLEGFNENG